MKYAISLIVVAGAVFTGNLEGQSCSATSGAPCTVTNTASATVTELVRLTLSAPTTDLGNPSEADFLAGQRDAAGPTATVVANRPWVVSVVGNTGAFTCAGAGCNGTKTAADLKWEVNGAGGSFANNMSTPSDLASGNATSGTSAQIMYRTLWSVANDTPGTYSLVVNFTLSAP